VLDEMKDPRIPPLERLRRFFTALVEAQNNDFGRCQCLVGRQPLGTETGSKIRQFKRNLDHAVRRLIQEGIDDRSIQPCDVQLAAAMIFGAFNSVARWRRPDHPIPTATIAKTYLDIFIHGIAAAPR